MKSNIKIEIRDWEEIDLERLAEFSLAVKKPSETTYNSNQTVEQEKRYLEFRKRFQPAKVLLAVRNGSLVGWLSYDTESTFSMEIGRWLPIVKKGKDSDQVFTLLIEKCRDVCEAQNLSRIEVRFDISNEKDETTYQHYQISYKKQGFELVDHEFYLRKILLKDSHEPNQPPVGLIYKQIDEIDFKAAYQCYYKSFENSKVRMFLNQTNKERKQFFEETFSQKKSIVGNASLALINLIDNEVVGIVILQARREEAHLAILAILPDHRGKKFGTSLVKEAISRCNHLGIKTMSLGVDADNVPAVNLYSKMGFEKVSSLITLAQRL